MDAASSLDANIIKDTDKQNEKQAKKQLKRTSVISTIVFGCIIASLIFQCMSIRLYYNDKIIILVAAISSIVVAVTATVKQIIIQRMDTLRVVHNKIRHEVNRFMLENNMLTRNVDGLEDQVVQLQVVEQQLAKIAEQQSTSADDFVSLVKEKNEILKEQRRLAKAELQEQLLTVVLRTDRDGDMQINEREANILILRMKNHPGVNFDEDDVRKALLQANGSLPSLMTIIREIGEEGDDNVRTNKNAMNVGDQNVESSNSKRKFVTIDDKEFMESVRMNYSGVSAQIQGQ